ncbi:MAG: hypothetical protein Q4A05_05230 [Ruminococcus sp.]|nr:hypothetical protein [Ruminococcus sp.]
MKPLSTAERIATAGFGVISLTATLLMLGLVIAVGNGVIRLAISLIWLALAIFVLIAKKKLFFYISVTLWLLSMPIIGFTMLWAPFIHSYTPWKYNIQRSYIEIYNRNSSKDFPAMLPRDITDYEFDYMPSIMQGTGHCWARFETSADTVKAYESEYAPQAIYTLPLSSFESGRVDVDVVSPEAIQPFKEDKSLDISYDRDFWDGTEATVYVLSATHNWNHPHSSAVIISDDHTKVQFAQLG